MASAAVGSERVHVVRNVPPEVGRADLLHRVVVVEVPVLARVVQDDGGPWVHL